MTRHTGIAVACICVAFAIQSASARERFEHASPDLEAATDELAPRDDLLGLRIGTSAWTSRRVLEKQGFQLRRHEGGESWYSIAGAQTGTNVPRQWRRSVSSAHFDGPDGEQVELSFVQMPGGAALSRLYLRMPDSIAPDALHAALDLSYGAQTCGNAWCVDVPVMSAHKNRRLQATLAADPHQRTVVLDATPQLQQVQANSFAEAVRECRRFRLGAPVWGGQFQLAC